MNQQLDNAIAVALKLELIKKQDMQKIRDFLSLAKTIRARVGGKPFLATMANFQLSRESFGFEWIFHGGWVNVDFCEYDRYIRVIQRLGLSENKDEEWLADISVCEGKLKINFTPRDHDKTTIYKSIRKLGSIIRVIEPLRTMIAEDSSEENARIKRLMRI